MAVLINITEILAERDAELDFTAEAGFSGVPGGGGEVEMTAPIKVSGVLRNIGEGVLLEADLTTTARLTCSRCLEEYQQPIEVKFTGLFQRAAGGGGDEDEEIYPIYKGRVDIEPLVYQVLTGEMPFKPLCRQDCAGICPICGRNKNIEPHSCQEEVFDIRMAKLKDLIKESQEE